jgi:hypothetical protein
MKAGAVVMTTVVMRERAIKMNLRAVHHDEAKSEAWKNSYTSKTE